MSDKKRKVPKLRFPGFTDSWEQRKLGELGKVSMCKRVFKSETSEIGEIPFYKIGTFGEVADSYISKSLFEEYRGKYPYPKVGDILISASGSIGRTVVYTGKAEYFQDSNIVWLDHGGKIDNRFLLAFYSVVKWAGIEGSTIKRLYNENILNTQICLPSLSEQEAVGNLFRKFDSLISLHQRKLDNVKMLKKSLLQKLFPKDGEKTPELRFPGFTDAWEQRKLGEVVFRRNAAEVTGALPGVEYEDVIPEEGRLNKNVSLKEVTKKGLEFLEGDVLFGKLRPYLKNWLFAEFNGVAVGDWWVLYSDKVDGRLIYYLIQTDSYQTVANLSTGTKMPRSDWTTVSQTIFAFPVSADEQLKIGKYFSSIDSLISLHQRKLDHLKELKKGLLQQMFV